MKKIVLGFTFLVFTLSCAQAQSWQWGRRGGGSAGLNNQAEKIVDMQCDKNGNVYMLAQLDGGTDAVFGTATGDTIPPTLPGGRDAALISYDCNGKFRWAKVLGGNIDDDAIGMGLDTLGHINVCVLSPSVIFKVDSDTSVTSNNRKLIKLIQYDTAGHYKWIKQPTPDTVKVANTNKYGAFNMTVMPNGDSYLFCNLGTGLISGTTNLVVPTAGYYMLKYNVAGVPKELVKLDMRGVGLATSYTDFSVTKSRKFIFNLSGYNITGDTLFIGGQVVKNLVNTACFSPTGSLLWRVGNKDSIAGRIRGRPYIDENNGLINVCGGGIWGTQKVDTIGDIPIINAYTSNSFLPFIASLDTLGNFKWVKWGSCNQSTTNFLNSVISRSDGRMFANGFGGGIVWDGFKFDGGNGSGVQTFIPSYNAASGVIVGMDSLRGNSAVLGEVITADNNNNIYVGGQLSSNIKVGTQTLTSTGGQSDFFVAKYGFANCSGVVPLKFLKFEVRSANEPTPNPSLEGNVLLQWQTANEINVSHFNIQRSINGRDFTTIGKVVANNKSYNEYSFMDNGQQSTVDSRLYYRIESVDKDGYKDYSEVRQIAMSNGQLAISVYPNPAKDFITIDCKGAKEFKIIDYLGRLVTHKKIINYQLSIINVQDFAKGMYIVQIVTDKGEVLNKKLLVE